MNLILVLNSTIILCYVVGWILTRKYKKDVICSFNCNANKLLFLYPLSLYILDKIKIDKLLDRNKKIKENLELLNSYQNGNRSSQFYWCNKIAIVLLVVFIFNTFSLFITVEKRNNGALIDGKYINRPSYGEGDKEVNLNYILKSKSDEYIEGIVGLDILERRYKDDEINKVIQKAQEYIDMNILGENESGECITKPLNLVNRVPNTSITIKWQLDEQGIINSKGEIDNTELSEEGALVCIIADISYYDTKAQYQMFFKILPKVKTKEEKIFHSLKNMLDKDLGESLTEPQVELPEKFEDQKIYFSTEEDKTNKEILFFGVIIAIVIFFLMDQELESKMKKRNIQMLIDYPEVIDKIALLLGAGMTIKGAWGKIAEEYQQKTIENIVYRRFAYEEMLITWHELQIGETEVRVYERFGRRIKLLPYLKFSSLIAQNLQKGSKGILDLLEFEAMEAFEERKQLAKRLGEEAGTKLLGPMMIMLVIVLIIIMVPAFMSMGF